MSTKRTTGWTGEYLRSPDGKYTGPNGRKWCRWHAVYLHQYVEVPKGRYSYCNNDCAHEYRLRNEPQYVRSCVKQRDQGICTRCGLDTAALSRALTQWRSETWKKTPDETTLAIWRHFWGDEPKWNGRGFVSPRPGALVRLGFNQDTSGHWQADHIVPVAEGGGECGLDGYRTLCLPCHKAVTREMHARLAEKRRLERLGAIPQRLPLEVSA